jgi:opacity protein-like surface antigen
LKKALQIIFKNAEFRRKEVSMRNASLVVTLIGVCFSLFNPLQAGEYGRGALTVESGREAGLGRAPLPDALHGFTAPGGTWGMMASLGWAQVDWDVGPVDGSESVFAPQVSLFYKTTDDLDVNVSFLFVSGEDEDDEYGSNEGDMVRLALGARYWVRTHGRVSPYVGAGIGYYMVDGATDKVPCSDCAGESPIDATVDIEDGPGAFLEGGVAFQLADRMYFHAGLTYDFLLGSTDATINDRKEDFDITSLNVNLGATWLF